MGKRRNEEDNVQKNRVTTYEGSRKQTADVVWTSSKDGGSKKKPKEYLKEQ